jgi:hypothetical protein
MPRAGIARTTYGSALRGAVGLIPQRFFATAPTQARIDRTDAAVH